LFAQDFQKGSCVASSYLSYLLQFVISL